MNGRSISVSVSVALCLFLAACGSDRSQTGSSTCASNCAARCPDVSASCADVCNAVDSATQSCIANASSCGAINLCGMGTPEDGGTNTDAESQDAGSTIACHEPGTSCMSSSQCRDFICQCADSTTVLTRTLCNEGICNEAATYESTCASVCSGSATVANNPDTVCTN